MTTLSMKIFAFSGAMALLSTAAFAEQGYVGLLAGGYFMHVAPASNLVGSTNKSEHVSGGYSQLFVGHTFIENRGNYFLSAEGSGELSTGNHKHYTMGSHQMSGANVKNAFALTALPGFYINYNTSAYLRLGAAYGLITAGHAADGSFNKKLSKNAYGVRGGLGLQYRYNDTLWFRGEYTYTGYKKVTFRDTSGYSNSLRVATNQLGVGILVSF